jgi:hypothetical protein
MLARCIANTGQHFSNFPKKPFGWSEHTVYGQLEIGKDYRLLGMIMLDGWLYYFISNFVASPCPSELFNLVDHKLPSTWHFKI